MGLFIASLCFFAHASASYAATYYVDSVSGSDSNAGTSTGTPWQTVAKVNSSTFSPGDSVLFMAGDLWRERLSFPSSGTSGNPITIGKYGTGTNPIFSGADVLPNANFTVYDASSSTYQIGGTVEGNGVAAMWENGVELKLATSLAAATSTPGSMYYNIATHVFYLHSAQANPNPITNGLVYEATKRGNVAIDNTNSWLIWQDLEIDKGFTNLSAHLITGANNIVRRVNYYDNANHSLSFYGSNNLGEDLYAQNNFGGAFLFYSPTSFGNTFQRVSVVNPVSGYGPGLQTHGGAHDNIVQDSKFYASATPSSQIGAIGLSADAGTSLIARRNYIYGKWSFAFATNSGAGINSEFSNNVIDGSQFGILAINLASTGATGVKVYNNTYYTSGTQPFISAIASTSVDVENNLVYMPGSGFYVNSFLAPITANYNLWYGSSRTTPFALETGQKTFAQWQALGRDANGKNVNPLLVNVGAGNFSLSSSSPAIDMGANLGTAYQLGLSASSTWPSGVMTVNQNTNGIGWDIGAYVYGVPALPPSVATFVPLSATTTISASATATSPATISSVQFYLDGSALGSPVTATSSPNTYSYLWNTTLATNGAHILSSLATTNLGASASSTPISVMVAN
ncbi:MAG: Ig-like domain-containing protein [Patescibacteria group bacterium]